MKNITYFILVLIMSYVPIVSAQTASASDVLKAQNVADRNVLFDLNDTGISKTVEFGADLAWANEQNFRRNILFMGLDQVDMVRASFQPTYPLINDTDLTQEQLDDLNYRVYLINTYVGSNTDLVLNCDHPFVDEYYVGNPQRWEKLIEVSTQKYMDAGHNIITVGAFNEPDYGWGQGSAQDMYDITALLNTNPLFDNIRLTGGSTLNCDEAQGWYEFLVPAGVNEGNTHQLAGSFDSYADFFPLVRSNGHHASADELHNIVEALVGYEYGMQSGIWWADLDLAGGEMVKAFDGNRIAYAEHRPNWTAAAVYRTPDDKIQAFAGSSERQAVTTTFNYISKERAVYYDGIGPQREFILEMPGGNGYANGQTNAERVINITWGEDIQPAIDGEYILVNRNSGLVAQLAGSSTQNGTNLEQGNYSGASHQKFTVTPVDSRIGGDFSYYRIQPVSNTSKSLDLNNFSLDNGANIHLWDLANGGNQQWYLDYSEDGWFYIRSRESSHCLDVFGASTASGGNIVQWEKNGGQNQQWRLIPADAAIEFIAPATPINLTAEGFENSIKLEWQANSEGDLKGYTILRATTGGDYNTIARDVTANSFIDNTVLTGVTYSYQIRAEDQSLNRSANSAAVTALATGEQALVAEYLFENTVLDNSINLNHAAFLSGVSYVSGNQNDQAVALNGSDAFIQLPPDVANHQEITIATWINWSGGGNWQRIFDFGNSTQENMFLTTNNNSGQLQFSIVNDGLSVDLTGPELPQNVWKHIAITLSNTGTRMYLDGALVAENTQGTINPLLFKPVQNYIGRSQYPDPMLQASLNDFKIYNYALPGFEISQLLNSETTYFQVSNRETGMFLDGMGNTANGSNAKQWANTTSDNAQWELIKVEGSFYQLKNKATGLFLDGLSRTNDGDACGMWANTMSFDAQWELVAVDGTHFQLKNRATGMFLDGMSRTNNGDDVALWANTTSNAAQWTFTLPSSEEATLRIPDSANTNSFSKDAVVIYPNPTKDILQLMFKNGVEEHSTIKIYNMLGKKMFDQEITKENTVINIESFSSGVYILNLSNGTSKSSYRLIKN